MTLKTELDSWGAVPALLIQCFFMFFSLQNGRGLRVVNQSTKAPGYQLLYSDT